jgi:YYY domain-containing protein
LGINPAVAYNLIIPTLFATFSMGAFSIGWNLIRAGKNEASASSWWVGISAALGAGLFGNLGSLRMIFRGFQQLGSMGAYDIEAGLLTKWIWAGRGFIEVLFGNGMPYSLGDWYWLPSRAIAAVPGEPEPITEFPWFTFIYADLHAHMIALPITVLALGWVLSVALGKKWIAKASLWQVAASLLFGALVIGALRPTNTWDLPTYLALGIVAITYVILRYYQPPKWRWAEAIDEKLLKGLIAIGAAGFLTVLAYKVLYLPFDLWYDQPYTEIQQWVGGKTTTQDYLTHWGIFLFVITSWLLWETRQWMAGTPLSHLRKLDAYSGILQALAIGFVIVFIGLFFLDIRIHWLALPLAVWAAILLLKPGLSEAKKIVLFLIGTCLFLSMMVEIIVLAGDVGRMNTVFKFYLQVWVMYAVCSAAALGWLVHEMKSWSMNWRASWQIVLTLLVSAAALFPLLGTTGKIRDRMSPDAPHTLDGMAFMPYSEYFDEGGPIPLGEDLKAIQWLQQNVVGSPVIVEGPTPLYHWGSRMTIYTGLPGVLGWDWHQIQQRGFVPTSKIGERRDAIITFYNTIDMAFVKDFLAKYNVSYIILGTLERNFYHGPGLEKFEYFEGDLWREVYRNGDSVIYEVIQEALHSE